MGLGAAGVTASVKWGWPAPEARHETGQHALTPGRRLAALAAHAAFFRVRVRILFGRALKDCQPTPLSLCLNP